jgi:hypothetical protein
LQEEHLQKEREEEEEEEREDCHKMTDPGRNLIE